MTQVDIVFLVISLVILALMAGAVVMIHRDKIRIHKQMVQYLEMKFEYENKRSH